MNVKVVEKFLFIHNLFFISFFTLQVTDGRLRFQSSTFWLILNTLKLFSTILIHFTLLNRVIHEAILTENIKVSNFSMDLNNYVDSLLISKIIFTCIYFAMHRETLAKLLNDALDIFYSIRADQLTLRNGKREIFRLFLIFNLQFFWFLIVEFILYPSTNLYFKLLSILLYYPFVLFLNICSSFFYCLQFFLVCVRSINNELLKIISQQKNILLNIEATTYQRIKACDKLSVSIDHFHSVYRRIYRLKNNFNNFYNLIILLSLLFYFLSGLVQFLNGFVELSSYLQTRDNNTALLRTITDILVQGIIWFIIVYNSLRPCADLIDEV